MRGQEGTSTTPRGPPSSWRALLTSAVRTPGLVHEAYSRFHRYSLHNQLLAWVQCVSRGVTPGPLATFKQWQALGRCVLRGEKALTLCVPITARSVDGDEETRSRTVFVYRARWFAFSQTSGREYEWVGTPDWHEGRALAELGIMLVPFESLDGNTQGYALPDRRIAINPVAALPHKTLFHEVAHVVLGHPGDDKTPRELKEAMAETVALLCLEALDLPGTEYARGYVQAWLHGSEFNEDDSQQIIKAAQTILEAGAADLEP